MELLSNCCGASIDGLNADNIGICSECKEGCGVEEVYKIGQLLDWTKEEHNEPFFGVIAYDDELEEVVCHRQNGGFLFLKELEDDSDFIIVEKEEVEEHLKKAREKYPNEENTFEYISKLSEQKQ